MIQHNFNYEVEEVPIDSILPSPENDEIYGKIAHDEQMEALIESICRRGLEEPIIVTADNFILSGHRRFHAVSHLGWKKIPVRRKSKVRREGNRNFKRLLTEYNPQRIKRAGTILKEALLRFSDGDPTELLEDYHESSTSVDVDFLQVDGVKKIHPISEKKRPFLKAVQTVIDEMRDYWPLSIRQVHYNLLNDPPLISTPKQSKFNSEHHRYRNDKKSYKALVSLLTSARYNGEVSMTCIDDPTRPQFARSGWESVSSFISSEMNGFLVGYHRDRQLDQHRHIEVFGEKNTLKTILEPVCREYYVPLSLGRGYGSVPVWRDIRKRFRQSGNEKMTLIVATDFDPEGLDLADDAVRSLRDRMHIPLDCHRVAATRVQIQELNLASDFNPAKAQSSRYDKFVERTGSDRTWELEALDPGYLRERLRAAIEANMDMEIYRKNIEQERQDCIDIQQCRRQIVDELDW